MKKWILGLLLVLYMWPVVTRAGGPFKAVKGIRQVNPAVVQRALIQASSPVQALRISNLPGRPVVQFYVKEPVVPIVRRPPSPKVYKLFFPENTESGFLKGRMFVPQGLFGPQKAVYRGMALQLPELKHVLTNGLEPRKSLVHRKVYTAFSPVTALSYANPAGRYIAGHEKKNAFAVLVKIPFTPALQLYARNMGQDMKLGNIVFTQDLPALFISDVWVLLEVNGQPNWYKAVLQKGKLVFLPANGELRAVSERNDVPGR